MKVSLKIACRQIGAWVGDPRVGAAFLLGFSLCLLRVREWKTFFDTIHSPMQIAEAYIVMGSSMWCFVGFFLGCVFLLSNAPFLNQRSPYEILRTGKKTWLTGQIIYVIFSCILYSLFILLCTASICAATSHVFLSNEWSTGMLLLSEMQPDFAPFPFWYPNWLHSTSPYVAMLFTFLFNTLYNCCVCLCMFAVNVYSSKNLGWIAAASIHIVGYIIYANGPMVFPAKYSLLLCAMPAYHSVDIYHISSGYAAIIFVAFLASLIVAIRHAAGHFEPLRKRPVR